MLSIILKNFHRSLSVGAGIAVAATFAGFVDNAFARPAPQSVTVTANCTTDATKGDGVRKACDSDWQTVTAPRGYVLAKETATGGLKTGNGSERECRVEFSDPIEVIPGLPQPRTIRLQAHARSPHGHWSGRGGAVCAYTVQMVPLPSSSPITQN